MRRFIWASVSLLTSGLALAGCRCESGSSDAVVPPGVSRCMDGIRRAVQSSTVEEVSRVYYDECADLYTEAGCREASHAAAHAALDEQLGIMAAGCKKAYCPTLGSFAFDICKDSFVVSKESITRAWPPLYDAIIAREAGASATDVSYALLTLYARSAQMMAAVGSAGAPGPSASAGAPPVGSASAGAPPAGPASAGAPPPSASAVAGSAAPGVTAGPAGAAAPAKAKAAGAAAKSN